MINAGIHNVKIILIGKSAWNSGNNNWTVDRILPVLVDPDPNETWQNWGASIRDLFFLDAEGNYVTDFNISESSSLPNIQVTIDQMLENLDKKIKPDQIILLKTYPNPFNPMLNISFTMNEGRNSNVSIFDINGQLVQTISNVWFSPGNHVIHWSAEEYSSGIYFVKFNTGISELNQKIMLLK